MSQASRGITIEINAQEAASALAKQFGLKSSVVLNALVKRAGYDDFGALKAAKSQSTAPVGTYAVVKFTVVNGNFTSEHASVFFSEKKGDLASLEEQARKYAVFFYDDPMTLEETDEANGDEPGTAYQKRLTELDLDGSFWCNGDELIIKNVHFREITKQQYEAFELARSL